MACNQKASENSRCSDGEVFVFSAKLPRDVVFRLCSVPGSAKSGPSPRHMHCQLTGNFGIEVAEIWERLASSRAVSGRTRIASGLSHRACLSIRWTARCSKARGSSDAVALGAGGGGERTRSMDDGPNRRALSTPSEKRRAPVAEQAPIRTNVWLKSYYKMK